MFKVYPYLTNTHDNSPIAINADSIKFIYSDEQGRTIVKVNGGESFAVKETPDEVRSLISSLEQTKFEDLFLRLLNLCRGC